MTEEYRILYDAWRRERQRPEIQPLPEGFYNGMAGYVTQLREQVQILDKSTVKGKIVEKEREHVEKMLQDLNKRRLNKLVSAELIGASVELLNLTVDEKKLQVELRRLMAAHTQSLKQSLRGKETIEAPPMAAPPQVTPRPMTPPEEASTQSIRIVRFTQPLPAIMGVDMKTYGPFKAEDVASLPAQNADNLIRKGIAKLVETEP